MPYFDRFDICDAYALIEAEYHVSGVLRERASNQRRNMSTGFQLHRMEFRQSPLFRGFESLSDNGKEIYSNLVDRYGFALIDNEDLKQWRELEGFDA